MTDAAIIVRGAREHNLRSVDLTLRRNQLIVFSGVSGSDKSGLAFDAIAENRRKRNAMSALAVPIECPQDN